MTMRKHKEMEPRMAMALSRYEVIAKYLSQKPHRGMKRKLLEEIAAESHIGPTGELFRVSAETLRAWVRRYRRGGLTGLMDKEHLKRGTKVLSEEQIGVLCRLKEEVPERTVDRIIKIAEETEKVDRGVLRRSTVHRALRAKGLSARSVRPRGTQDLDRFEADFPNALWQSDMLVGPWLPDPSRPGKVRRANLFAFLDDHSRLLLDGRFSFQESLPYLELSFRRALQKWGIPRRVYYDNGKVYRSNHMKQIVASLGIRGIIHTTSYRPEGHGKIEALNRFIRSSFIAELKASRITTLDELNEAFHAWARGEYNNRIHSETSEAPLERWRKGVDRVRFADEETLRQAFLWKELRTADKAGLFSLLGTRYQVGPKLAKKRLEIRFDPEALHEVEVFSDGSFKERVRPFDVSTHRRPVVRDDIAPSQNESNTVPEADWLGHLVAKSRLDKLDEPKPRDLGELARARREQNIEAVLGLFSEKLDGAVVDAAAVREDIERFGLIDVDSAHFELDDMFAFGAPRDQHVSYYLSALRASRNGGAK